MYFLEIVGTTLSLLTFSLLLVVVKERRTQGLGLVGTSLLAILISVADLTSRNEPVQQRAVYQLMHFCFLGIGLLHVYHQHLSIVALGLTLLAASILLENQVSVHTRALAALAGVVALCTKQEVDTAYPLAVAAIAFTQDKSEDVLAYALILLTIYPLMMVIYHYNKD